MDKAWLVKDLGDGEYFAGLVFDADSGRFDPEWAALPHNATRFTRKEDAESISYAQAEWQAVKENVE